MTAPDRAMIEAALAAAARAPSSHNTQPWRVEVTGAHIGVRIDRARWLRHGDPARRDLHLSVGAFIEALRLSLVINGAGVECSDPQAFKTEAGATLSLRAGDAPPATDRAAASLLRRRQTSRLRYAPRPPAPEAVAALTDAVRAAGLELHLAAKGTPERADLDGWTYDAVRESWLDPRAVAELASWVRVDPEGARRPEDGLSTHCLGLSPGETLAFMAATRAGLWRAAHATFAAPVLGAALARAETRVVQEAPLFGVLVAPGDAADAGAALLHVWLAATAAGLALAPISVLLDRRGWELGRRLGVAPGRLVLAFRLGMSAPPPRSWRRAVPRFARFV